MRVSRIFCQMMRVISSPSISTTGVFTLILDIHSPAGDTRARPGNHEGREEHEVNDHEVVIVFCSGTDRAIHAPFCSGANLRVLRGWPSPRSCLMNKLRILDRIVVQYVSGVPAMTRHVVTFALVTM